MRRLALALALLLCALPAAARDGRFDYVIRKGGLVFGTGRAVRTETASRLDLAVEQRIRFSLMGVDSEVREALGIGIDRASGTLAVSLETVSLFKSRSLEIEIAGRRATLRDRLSGATLAFAAAGPIHFDIDYFLDVDRFRLTPGARFAYTVLDPETVKLETQEVRVVAAGSGEVTLDVKRALYESTETYDAEWNLIRSEVPALGLVIEREGATANPAGAGAGPGVYDIRGGDLLEFATALTDADLAGARRLTATLVFRDARPDAQPLLDLFHFEEARQAVAVEADPAGTTTVRVTVDRGDFRRQLDVPVPATVPPGYEVYLKPSRLILPDGPKVRNLRRLLFKGGGTVGCILARAVNWIHANIRSAIVPEMLTSEEILAARRGMCMQYGTLLAALLRGEGIPTRCAMGEKFSRGRFLPHLYNEVWTGAAWIPVDATEGPGDPARLPPNTIKFAHGADLLDLTRLKSRLLNNLTLKDARVE